MSTAGFVCKLAWRLDRELACGLSENEVTDYEKSASITTTMEPTEETKISTATTSSDKTASTPEEVKNDASAIVFD